jgi:hypothetical protein
MDDALTSYWYSRFLFERGLALIYLVAFLVAVNQFVPLLGERGLEPVPDFIRAVPFRASPSLFYAMPRDVAFMSAAWLGVALSLVALAGLPQRWGSVPAAGVWLGLWVLYLSFVNVGQTFYGFGWETLLLEAGFLTIFAGGSRVVPSAVLVWLYRWLLFRLMLGAGLIKLRGDPCWRDLTCLDYFFETQPMPNALSWYFHWLPPGVHHAGVVFNHIVELAVPFLYLLPQPFAAIGGLVTIVFQGTLIAGGNLSWLNWLTIVLCIPTLDDRWLSWMPISLPPLTAETAPRRAALGVLAALVAILSLNPVRNLISSRQMMNTSFEPLHLVNTYGAFGSITRTRTEIIVEGTADEMISPTTKWRVYEFKAKPGDPSRALPQYAPYHLRLDWLMWFAAMSSSSDNPWFTQFLVKLLEGDRAALSLLRDNPFPDQPPRWVRARYAEYHFTTADERRQTGRWWTVRELGDYMPPVALRRRP